MFGSRLQCLHREAIHRKDDTDQPVRSFQTLLDHLTTLTRNDIRYGTNGPTIATLTTPTDLQRRIFEHIGAPIPLTLT